MRVSPKKNGRFMVLVAGNLNTNIGSLPAKIKSVSMSGSVLTVTLDTQNYGCVDVFGIGCSVAAA